MPLASSREATAKASEERRKVPTPLTERWEKDGKGVKTNDRKRRQSLGVSSTRKRPFLGSPSNATDKENSLPGRRRRRSLSAKEIGFMRTEPVLTRSASKKKRRQLLPPGGAGDSSVKTAFLFSPPNQKKIEEIEEIKVKSRLRARDARVDRAKENGQRLVYNRFGELVDGKLSESPKESNQSPLDVQVEHCDVSVASKLTERSSGTTNDDILRVLEGMKESIDSSKKQTTESQEAQSLKLELETQKARGGALEEAKKQLELEKRQLEERVASTKEAHLSDKGQLEGELQALKRESSRLAEEYEKSKSTLEQRIDVLSGEKADLDKNVALLEQRLKSSQDELDAQKQLVEDLQSNTKDQHETLTEELRRRDERCALLQVELETEQNRVSELTAELEECRRDLIVLKDELVPDLEDLLENTRVSLQKKNNEAAAAEQEVEAKTKIIDKLSSDLDGTKASLEEERLEFQNLNEASTKAHDRLSHDLNHAKEERDVLSEQLERKESEVVQKGEIIMKLEDALGEEKKVSAQLDEDLRIEQRESGALRENLKQEKQCSSKLGDELRTTRSECEALQDDLTKEKQCTTTLEEDLSEKQRESDELHEKLRITEEQIQTLQQNLEDAHEQIEELSATKQEAVANYSDTSEALETLKAELEAAEERICQLKEDLCKRQLHIESLEKGLKLSAQEREDMKGRMENFDAVEEDLLTRLQESERIRRTLHNRVIQLCGNMRVFVRIRPPLEHEIQGVVKAAPASRNSNPTGRSKKRKAEERVQLEGPFSYHGVSTSDGVGRSIIRITKPPEDRGGLSERTTSHDFYLDHVFGPNDSQDDIFAAADPLIQSAVDGYNVALFAYGQTGSGKTHTMLGDADNEGIVGRSIKMMFDTKHSMEALSRGKTQVSISVEVLEIYNEEIFDLLAPKDGEKLEIRGSEVEGNVQMTAGCEEDVMHALELAQERRCVKATKSNSQSSRSHLLFTINFLVQKQDGSESKGKLHICDLAGSERLKKSGSQGKRLKETQNINSSLLVLQNVIKSLQDGEQHVPYRESKLTSVLQNSLGGNSKTLAIVCCNPLSSHYQESLQTLKFAQNASKVELKAKANFTC